MSKKYKNNFKSNILTFNNQISVNEYVYTKTITYKYEITKDNKG